MTGTFRTDIKSYVERASTMLARIEQHAESHEPIRHGTQERFVFIRIGIRYTNPAYDGVVFPVLVRNIRNGEYVIGHNLLWGGDEYGFCWDSGAYYDEDESEQAMAQFLSECDEVVYTAN